MKRHRAYPQDEVEIIHYGDKENLVLSYEELELAGQAIVKRREKAAAEEAKKAAAAIEKAEKEAEKAKKEAEKAKKGGK